MKNFNVKSCILLPLTIAVVLFMWFAPADMFGIDGLTVIQQRTIAIFCYAALMWMFEIIPAWATSVSTIVFLLLAISNKGFANETQGAMVNFKELMAAFADPVIMLFLGGFVLAIAASKVGLDLYHHQHYVYVHEQHRYSRHDAGFSGTGIEDSAGERRRSYQPGYGYSYRSQYRRSGHAYRYAS